MEPIDAGWLMCTEADVPEDDAWLVPAEARVLAGLRFDKRRREWRLGRYAAKRAVLGWLRRGGDASVAHAAVAVGPGAIEIRAAGDGAPDAWLDGTRLPVALSISHRSGVALCAVAGAGVALGCDVERVEPRSEAFVQDYFTAEERELVARVSAGPGDARWLAAALTWSAKEAALKALRVGLRRDTRSVIVKVSDEELTGTGAAWRPIMVIDAIAGAEFTGYWLRRGEYVCVVVSAPATGVPLAL
jgi:4'-phosphopantetheinyl transferase